MYVHTGICTDYDVVVFKSAQKMVTPTKLSQLSCQIRNIDTVIFLKLQWSPLNRILFKGIFWLMEYNF